jgi:NADH-quinone oxidoreductase subunit J
MEAEGRGSQGAGGETVAMQDLLFYLFSGLALGCGFLVVANPFNRSPVTSAMFLVLSIVALSGLFVLLHAFFLAAVQILVYAGAVMVLFLFVIMLLDVSAEEKRAMRRFGWVTGVLAVGALALMLLGAIHGPDAIESLERVRLAAPSLEGNAESLGRLLFLEYLLPFEVLSVLLLVAMLGVVLLSKRDLS